MNDKDKSIVPKNIEDSIMKSITEVFQEDALKFFEYMFQKFVDNEYKEKLSEVFEMTALGNMLIEKDIEKGEKKSFMGAQSSSYPGILE